MINQHHASVDSVLPPLRAQAVLNQRCRTRNADKPFTTEHWSNVTRVTFDEKGWRGAEVTQQLRFRSYKAKLVDGTKRRAHRVVRGSQFLKRASGCTEWWM